MSESQPTRVGHSERPDEPLLDEDDEPIRVVEDSRREGWKQRRVEYSDDDYRRDREKREER